MNANGSELRSLLDLPPFPRGGRFWTHYTGYQGVDHMIWSPDSRRIIFTAAMPGDCEGLWSLMSHQVTSSWCKYGLYRVNSDGSGLRKITRQQVRGLPKAIVNFDSLETN